MTGDVVLPVRSPISLSLSQPVSGHRFGLGLPM